MRVFWLPTSACVATFPRMLQDPGPLVHLRLAIAGGTPAARHTLYYLDELAELVLALEAEVRPALVAAVGRLVNGIRITNPGLGLSRRCRRGGKRPRPCCRRRRSPHSHNPQPQD